MKLLIFGNPVDNRDILTTFFRSKLVVVDETSDLEEALDLTRFYEYDAVVLRVTDTRPAEIELIRRLHLSGLRCPILAVSQLLSEATRLRILEAGVDDLIVNAISHEETFLRVQNQVRRSRGFQSPSLAVGNIEINMNAKKIFVGQDEISLTKKEYQIVEILALRKGCVLSKEAILDHLYGGLDEPNPKIIDVFICKIRKKLISAGADDLIQTNWGRGYMIVDRREAEARITETPMTSRVPFSPRERSIAG
ncbi:MULTISPECIES: response regulator transcription factor [unclassified Acidiphilium]|uniref:response regulator transcription factor n=1 Tax=unclassified Acidiphilium TaxID=2617493 RepID=UPI000BCA3F73|nr:MULTISPECIES: response regulator transcription factor [unclassified Acidiphilium]OYV55548.1 MAG: two-component system response regulator [Acidiphilium sp. 20-67-58]HQT60134.1 response regulator transcription factor [Acidiphilium sp.]